LTSPVLPTLLVYFSSGSRPALSSYRQEISIRWKEKILPREGGGMMEYPKQLVDSSFLELSYAKPCTT